MAHGVAELLNGILALILALLVWRITGSWIGWLVLFAPGAGLVLWGLYRVFRD